MTWRGTHLHINPRCLATVQILQDFFNSSEVFFVHPVHDEPIGCEQHQLTLAVIRLQGSKPGVELLSGKLVPEYFQTLMPYVVRHDSLASDASEISRHGSP